MPNEAPNRNSSSFGDGIYCNNLQAEDNSPRANAPQSSRKQLLNEYIRSCIDEGARGECGCHFGAQRSDPELLHKLDASLDKNFNVQLGELRSISSQQRPRQLARGPSERNKLREPHEQQQVTTTTATGVTREGSAFTRLAHSTSENHCTAPDSGTNLDRLEEDQLCCHQDKAGTGSSIAATATPACQSVVGHRHQRKLFISNEQSYYGISGGGQREEARLFINDDEDESVQSSVERLNEPPESRVRGNWPSFVDINSRAREKHYERSPAGRDLIRGKIYEPTPLAPGAAASPATPTSTDCCERDRLGSWPCHCFSWACVEQAHQISTARPNSRHSSYSDAGPKQIETLRDHVRNSRRPLHLLAQAGQHPIGNPGEEPPTALATTTSEEEEDDDESDDLDQFDVRSALDCVEEFSPTWSDLSSGQIDDSVLDQIESREEVANPFLREPKPRRRLSETSASWIGLQQEMEKDATREPREQNDNNNNNNNNNNKNCNDNDTLGRQGFDDLSDPVASDTRNGESSAGAPRAEDYLALHQSARNCFAGRSPGRPTESGVPDENRGAPGRSARQSANSQKRRRRKRKTKRIERADHKEARGEGAQQGERADSTNCLAAGLLSGERADNSRSCESASMRVARDLAKISIPSLASLQYLPGQLDARPAKTVDRRAASRTQRKPKTTSSSRSTKSGASYAMSTNIKTTTTATTTATAMTTPAEPQEPGSGQPISAQAQEDSHESCLLDRLCLCNCMASKKPRSADASEADREAPRTSTKGSRASCGARASPVSLGESVDLEEEGDVSLPSLSSHDSERNEHKATTTATREAALAAASPRGQATRSRVGGNVVRVRDDTPARPASALSRDSEKQSPSFLNLLKPQLYPHKRAAPSANLSGDVGKKLRGRPAEARAPISESARRGLPASSKVLGSVDDLEASGRSSSSAASASRATSDFCSPLSSPSSGASLNFAPRFRGHHQGAGLTKVGSADAHKPERTIQSEDERVAGKIDAGLCRNCQSASVVHSSAASQDQRKKAAYRRLMSPSKLFASSSQSNLCEDCRSARSEQKSFLSRSLSRLSGRSSKRTSPLPGDGHQQESSATPRVDHEQQVQPASRRGTPTPDRLHDTWWHSDSINSLEEINLCHSLPYEVNEELGVGRVTPSKSATRLLRTPEIVLSRVEYQDARDELSGSSVCSSERMARSTSGTGTRRHLRSNGRYSGRNHDWQMCERTPPAPERHGSEISFVTATSDGSVYLAQGPFSLPGSPRASRRNMSRSPRLSHSPVPFHAPASESTKIEDGLKVCSTGHFEKHIGHIKGNQIEAQKRMFTTWINHYTPNLIMHDLFGELQDGIKLIGLLATLTRDRRLLSEYERLNRDKSTYVNRLALTPTSRLTHISNVHLAIDYMRTRLGMKLVNLNPMDIVSGKENVILGLCWNIILHFQLSRDLLPSGSDCSSSVGSLSLPNQPGASGAAAGLARKGNKTRGQLVDELSSRDLMTARSKLLAHINKRFNLKLTNLTSNLVDGDVLMAIIRQLVPASSHLHGDSRLAAWPGGSESDNERKLELCFQLARDYLNVPLLISASDLKRETMGANNSKPLLVYLSMLLKANPRDCSTDQMLELRQLDESLREPDLEPSEAYLEEEEQQPQRMASEGTGRAESISETIRRELDDLDTGDKFHVDKLRETLAKIARLDELIETAKGVREGQPTMASGPIERLARLKQQAEQVDALIDWINEADKLFEAKQEAAGDLAGATDLYDRSVVFFSPANLPQLDTSLCPTLERQYRECLSAARQHILGLEQITRNWASHKQASKELKDWLMLAELELESALRPNGHVAGAGLHSGQVGTRLQFGSDAHLDLQKSRLDELIEFFELEPIDVDDLDGPCGNPFSMPLNSSLTDGRSSSLSSNLDPGEHSLSGSLLSLGSASSRMSALATSKRAAHHRLFDNLELQSRLLAAMLEPEQRDSILVGVKTFNLRMKQILEYKVPQVIGDICMSINRYKMQIKEQDELASEPELEDLASDEPALATERACSQTDERATGGCRLSPESEPTVSISDKTGEVSRDSPPRPQPAVRDDKRTSPKRSKQKRKARANPKHNDNNKSAKRSSGKISTNIAGTTGQASPACDDDDQCKPYYRLLWNKIVRASRISLSFNIILLICLAGICVVPLIQKDACCELSQAPIQTEHFTLNQRPT